jgi:PKD repeat protein
MVTRCASYVRGRMLRVTRLDACGRVVYGDDSVVTSKGFVSVAYTANVDDGEEINVPNAAGERCIYEPANPSFLGYTVEVTFCNVDPDLYAMMTGQRVVTDAFGDVVGFTMDTAVNAQDSAFALEVWAGSPATGGCAEGAEGNYGYILLPFLQGGIVGDFTIENAEVTFTISNAATKDGNAWGVGPYDVVVGLDSNPAPLPDPLTPTEHLYFIQTGIAPPEAQCGARPLLDPEDAALTGVTFTPDEENGLIVEFTPTPAGSDPWWIDFGDGSWDYSADGSAITHTYASAGNYTITAYRGSSVITNPVSVSA